MATDRFGNPLAPNLPYARGRILVTTEDDFRKLQRAWALIRERVTSGLARAAREGRRGGNPGVVARTRRPSAGCGMRARTPTAPG